MIFPECSRRGRVGLEAWARRQAASHPAAPPPPPGAHSRWCGRRAPCITLRRSCIGWATVACTGPCWCRLPGPPGRAWHRQPGRVTASACGCSEHGGVVPVIRPSAVQPLHPHAITRTLHQSQAAGHVGRACLPTALQLTPPTPPVLTLTLLLGSSCSLTRWCSLSPSPDAADTKQQVVGHTISLPLPHALSLSLSLARCLLTGGGRAGRSTSGQQQIQSKCRPLHAHARRQ